MTGYWLSFIEAYLIVVVLLMAAAVVQEWWEGRR